MCETKNENSSNLLRGISENGGILFYGIDSTAIVRRMEQLHKTSAVTTAALGRLLTGVAMMGQMLKSDSDSVTVQIKGGGPLGTLLAVSDAEGNVRGYVQNPGITLLEKYAGKLDVGAAVGTDGMLTVIRDLQMKEPYVGSVALVSGEIGDDVTAYFAQSEQIPTACALGVLVDVDQSVRAAGGYIIQLLPGAPDATIDQIEAGIRSAGNVTALLDSGMDAEQLLKKVLDGFDVEILETAPVEYRCYCSREKVERTLLTLGRDELEQIVRSGETLHVDCQFCDKIYDFTPENVQEILNRA
mgnify:CR=1 FL=1